MGSDIYYYDDGSSLPLGVWVPGMPELPNDGMNNIRFIDNRFIDKGGNNMEKAGRIVLGFDMMRAVVNLLLDYPNIPPWDNWEVAVVTMRKEITSWKDGEGWSRSRPHAYHIQVDMCNYAILDECVALAEKELRGEHGQAN